jgi:5-methylcytosine-specific restriction endonuclease McrA
MLARAIVQRDGWVCGICGEACDPRYYTIDRVVPGARGGGYSLDNCRLAHFICNSRRGAGDGERPVVDVAQLTFLELLEVDPG